MEDWLSLSNMRVGMIFSPFLPMVHFPSLALMPYDRRVGGPRFGPDTKKSAVVQNWNWPFSSLLTFWRIKTRAKHKGTVDMVGTFNLSNRSISQT